LIDGKSVVDVRLRLPGGSARNRNVAILHHHTGQQSSMTKVSERPAQRRTAPRSPANGQKPRKTSPRTTQDAQTGELPPETGGLPPGKADDRTGLIEVQTGANDAADNQLPMTVRRMVFSVRRAHFIGNSHTCNFSR